MITYIYHKDSTLWAFEGPEKPTQPRQMSLYGLDEEGRKRVYAIHQELFDENMSTARESALPVVNADQLGFDKHPSGYANIYLGGQYGKHPIQIKNEPVALPGWGLEIVMSDGWQPTYADPDNQGCTTPAEPEAYRLVRSEPENKRKKSNTLVGDDLLKQFVNKQINLTFYSQKLWHSDKPFPSSPFQRPALSEQVKKDKAIHDWLSTAYEVVNPEVIPSICKTATGLANFSEEKHAHLTLVDGDQITLPEGFMISTSVQYPIDSPTKYFATIKDLHYKPVVEPSESQEDMMCELFQRLYDCLERGQGTLQNITTDFTITRK